MINHGCMICIKYDPWFTGTIHHIDWGRSRYLPMISHCDILTLVHWSLDPWARECSSSHLAQHIFWHIIKLIVRGGVGVDGTGQCLDTPSRDNCATPPTEIITRLHNERGKARETRREFSQLATYYRPPFLYISNVLVPSSYSNCLGGWNMMLDQTDHLELHSIMTLFSKQIESFRAALVSAERRPRIYWGMPGPAQASRG